MNPKALIKRIVPNRVWQFGRSSWDGIQRIPGRVEAALHPWRRDSIQKLRALKDVHKGERCVIIGNGPSLNKTDIQKIRDEYSFGLNRIYLAWEEWGFTTSYFLSVNDLVIEQCAHEIMALSLPVFISWRAHRWLEPQDNLHFLYTTYTGPKFAKDVSKRVWEGATVTYTALQLAYHMGFSTVVLIGVDHSFSSKGKPNQTVESQGDDPNHFSPHYFGKGFRWQLPDLETSEVAYQMAHRAFLADGRQVLDATVGGKLQVFPKVDFDQYFGK
ncbi:MAG TPA: DUF115 domain-containing protein [Brevefilum fermentans]|jgi:hypothetical protein|uniref:6-hydroxymethylpterin diphosphokinase MptE-like domain-containing protein n=1 Tax=Candidatus Brevifilum fermentans TaxID=1986204 RepID=A0A1Y6K9B9_9CHLR|nr:6-hydroxymethylpterin diphosphokinase MptE-like protein [Brevefilum fermentans]MDI9565420.1 DUF115 domain-containing protein [Chloroflexota bacterium]OQB83479.1 MAG: hypothetical protein BWX85_01239 [Chloroflexi bacterium ADurb.Bin120]SMX55189.1 conserved protein of unknown function [Brevefilum fermentans]HOM68010.1 DUF115 domain-containing protein [Brevefilum fermentans]HPX95811.1 DUF115 domain-containing protein [Brevefilum fermentans]